MVDAEKHRSNETSGESEGALMAKHETNAQRSAREAERRTIADAAGLVAELITSMRKTPNLVFDCVDNLSGKELSSFRWPVERKRVERKRFIEAFFDKTSDDLKNPSKQRRNTYAFVGEMFCEFHENPPKFLRLVADILEGKLPYSPGNDWNDAKIKVAYGKARWAREESSRMAPMWPTFSEFLEIFRKQNAKLSKPPSERSLRRSLKRLGYHTAPDKRGRPKGK